MQILKSFTHIAILSILLTSCASLTSGRDLPRVKKAQLPKVAKSITVRITGIPYVPHDDRKVEYFVSKSPLIDLYSDYFKKLNNFAEISFETFPFERIEFKDKKSAEDYVQKNFPSYKSEYFVDIYISSPIYPHGSGLGMLGGLISTVSLGCSVHNKTSWK